MNFLHLLLVVSVAMSYFNYFVDVVQQLVVYVQSEILNKDMVVVQRRKYIWYADGMSNIIPG